MFVTPASIRLVGASVDKQLSNLFVKFINECLRVVDADPLELARYMFVIYKEHRRLDWLSAFGWSIVNHIEEDDNMWIGETI